MRWAMERRAVAAAMALSAAAAADLPAAAAENPSGGTVTLQQGANGYRGCTAVTLWGPKAGKPAAAGASDLYLRGTSNHVLIRFELPAALRGRKVARARLMVFVPEARKVRMINEILCREVTEPWTPQADWEHAAPGRKWKTPGGTLDDQSDYHRGRPKGAVDSYSIWEFNGRWFPHKYRFLTVPPGGKWIDFNLTPLVRKWLADPAGNHGVALEPITQRDKRFPNRIEIDLPGPDSRKSPTWWA